MVSSLLKKQLLEVFTWLYVDNKTGKRKSKKGIVTFVALYTLLFAFLGVIFFVLAKLICTPFYTAGFGWLYWCLMGLVSLFMGVFGSVFNTYASLYQAKDNDLLLSMPVSPAVILLTRLSGVYAVGLMYELIVMIPTVAVWFIYTPLKIQSTLFSLLIPIILSILILVISAVLGYFVALISSKLKRKNILTVIISLIFIFAYYFFCSQASQILQKIVQNPALLDGKMRNVLFLLYHMGLAAEGNIVSMLIFSSVTAILLILTYFVMSHSFFKLATSNRGEAKKKYKEMPFKIRSSESALLYKEFCRFKGSTNYMLNCGLGTIFMPLAAIALIWKSSDLQPLLSDDLISRYIIPASIASICLLSTMNDITAPSVSLEGKSIWLIQSLPVSSKQVLKAKLKLHLIPTFISALPLILTLECILKPDIISGVLMFVLPAVFIVLTAQMGLIINLKMPNLNWTSEIIPIKQSFSSFLALFSGWTVVALFAVVFYLLRNTLSMTLCMILSLFLLIAVCSVLFKWIMSKGSEIFKNL